jgi:hypothetical protein
LYVLTATYSYEKHCTHALDVLVIQSQLKWKLTE